MNQERQLPWQVFRLASLLLPHFDRAFEQLKVNPTDLFVLSHLKHYGVVDEQGRIIMLKRDIRSLLKRIYGYSETRASTIIQDLHDKGLIELEDLTRDARKKIFGDEMGYKPVVILHKRGQTELNLFNSQLNRLFHELTREMSSTKFKALSISLAYFADHAASRLQKSDGVSNT